MSLLWHFISLTLLPYIAKQNAYDQVAPPLKSSINLAPKVIRANGRRTGIAFDAPVCDPPQDPSLVEGESSIEPRLQKVKGYTVMVNWKQLPPEEQKARRAELARIVAQSIMRLRRQD